MVATTEEAFALLAVAAFLCVILFAAGVMVKQDLSAGIVVVIWFAISSVFWGAMLLACDALQKNGWLG